MIPRRRIIASCLLLVLGNYTFLPVTAAEISVGGPLPTDTHINTAGNVTDILTNTTVNGGQTGINSFDRFNVNDGDIVNLNLINQQNKLVNLIFDSSPSQINGIVNSYKGGQIGGNVLFANPNGFVVGSNGVFNVGSLTLMTPTLESMKDLMNINILGKLESYNDKKIERLIGFSFNDENYLIAGNQYEPVELAPGKIQIAGKINSGKGIDLISGSEVTTMPKSELNANMSFLNENGQIKVTPSLTTSLAPTQNYPTKLAMQDGNNIVIVASNNNASGDVLSAIVNLNGKVQANGGDVIAKSEVFQTGNKGNAQSQINVKSGADIDGNNVLMQAVSKVSDTVTGIKDDLNDNVAGGFLSFLTDEIVHIANVETSVNVEKDSDIKAANNVNLSALSDMDISAGAILGTLPSVNINITNINAETKAIVNEGASIKAKDLNVNATNDLNLSTTTKTTNYVDKLTGKEIGSYSFGVTVTDLKNKAEISKGANLSIEDNIDVLANTISNHKDTVKNGLVPIIDKNRGPVGAAVSVIVTNVVNEAIMNADAEISGKLSVVADYTGNVISSVSGYSGTGTGLSGGTAEDGFLDKLWRYTLFVHEVNSVVTRSNAKYNDIDVAGAIGVIVDNVTSTAKIGNSDSSDTTKDIKPEISASQIQVKSNATDYKSTLYVQAESEQGVKAASGAIAINYKDLNSNANAYGNFTLGGADKNLVYTTDTDNSVVNNGEFYKKENDNILLTKEQYDALKDDEKSKYAQLEQSVSVYKYKDGDKIVYTDNSAKKVSYTKADGIYYQNGDKYISQAEYNDLSEEDKSSYKLCEKPVYFYLANGQSAEALSITADTEIIHPMAWIDWVKDLLPLFSKDNWNQAGKDVAEHWNSIETNDVFDYLSKLGALGELSNVMDEGKLDILNAIDFNNLGAYGFFNTFAQSKANAQTQQGDTKALSGAIGIALFNANSNAVLDDNSNVVMRTTNPKTAGVNVSASSDNEVWTASTLMDLFKFNQFLSGSTARDGSAYGLGGAFSYSDSNVIAKIGENVNIINDKDIQSSTVGNVNVNANEEGNFLTISAGSSSPDKTGLSGAIGMTVLGSGIVSAAIENGSNVEANNVTVNANKDDNFINTVIAFANGQNSYGFGLSSIILTDSVEAYIAGTVKALESIKINAGYDKLIVNANANLGIAKEGTDDPIGKVADDEIHDYYGLNDLFSNEDPDWVLFDPESSRYSKLNAKIKKLQDPLEKEYDWSRPLNPDKETAATAGGINLNVAVNDVKAYVKDGATLTAEKNVTVNAFSTDKIIDTNAVVAANGKSGTGATIMVDAAKNDVEASIGAASVDAKQAINVSAKDDYNLIAASAGIAHGKDKAGAGNVSSSIQLNNITAAIKDGAKINKNYEGAEQTVKVEGNVDSNIIKAVGALAVQYGGNAENAKSTVGATLDGDGVKNVINAYIKGAEVNAVKSIDVNAENNDRLLVVDVAGSAAAQSSAYGGTLGAYVALNEVSSYIENSKINTKTFTTTERPNQDVNLKSTSSFNEIDVVGTVAAGNKTGIGLSARVDAVVNDVKSYIKDSTVNAQNSATLTNSDSMSQISVAVAGSGSTEASAGSGVISLLVDVTDQSNYIENSTLNVGSLTLDTDKVLDTVSVTGAVAAGLKGTSVGLSGYALGVSHDINTYIKNSNITSDNNIQLTSDFVQDAVSIIFGGAGGSGIAASGAISVLVNDSNINTYVLAEESSKKKDLSSKKGSLKVQSTNDVNTVTVDGNVGISTQSVSAGGAINTTVYDSDISAGVDGAVVSVAKGVDILAKADQSHISTEVGASVGSTAGVEGSVDTVVMNQDINAYIKNATVTTTAGDVIVEGSNKLDLTSGVGAVAGATSGFSVGGSIGTLVINQTVNSDIIKSSVHADNGKIENNSKSEFELLETLLGFGGASSAAINGTVATQVLNIDTTSEINNAKLSAKNGVINNSCNKNKLETYVASANGAGTTAIGGVVYSLVDNSTANALINGSTSIQNTNSLINTAKMDSNYLATLFNASGAGTGAVNGTVSTYVLNSQANAIIDQSTLNDSIGDITVQSDNNSKAVVVMSQGNGAGEAALNGSVNTFVSSKKSIAQINNSVVSSTGNIEINANADNDINATVVGGSGSGISAITGAVNTIVSSDKINAGVNSSSISTSVKNASSNDNGILVNANDTLTVIGHTGSGAGSGGGAAGGAIVTGVITNKVEALVNNSDLSATNADVILNAIANETIGDSKDPFITIAAAGSGGIGISGAVDTLVLNSSSVSKVSGKKLNGLTAGDRISLKGEGNTNLLLSVGVGSGGTTGVGGTVSTVVVNKDIQAVADNTNMKSSTVDIITESVDNIENYIVAGSVGATAGVTGAVNTTVISSNLNTGIRNSTVNSNRIDVNSNAEANYDNVTGGVGSGGALGVGASVVTNVVGYHSSSYVENSKIRGYDGTSRANNLNVNSQVDTVYDLYAISGAIGGTAGVGGVIETNVVNNTISAYVTGNIYADTLSVKAKDTVDFNGIAGTLAGGSVAGVGATIQTNSVTSTVLSYIGGREFDVNDIEVKAEGIQNFNDLAVIGFGGGQVAVNGSSLANIVNATVKSYVTENSKITSGSDFDVIANNTLTITETVGTGAVGEYAAVAASVAVNKISNTVEAYTENNVSLDTNTADFIAKSNTNLGKENNKLSLIAGSVAAGGGLAGSVLVNDVENKTAAYIGTNNEVKASEALNLNAQDDTFIYETVGGLGVGGVAGVGASVGVNTINNTVISTIGSGSVLNMPTGNIGVIAISNEKIDAIANVVGGGAIALSGGVLYNTIGKSVGNAESNGLTGSDAKNYETAKNQADAVLTASTNYKNVADETFRKYFNDASTDVADCIDDANTNINSSLESANTDVAVAVSADNIEQKDSTFSLFMQSDKAGSSIASTDRDNTTSAFIDSGVIKIDAKDLLLQAKDTNNVTLDVDGNTYGGAAVGISAAVSNVNTTTNAFISNNVVGDLRGKLEINSESIDNQNVDVKAASGGIISGSGGIAKINSNKTTNSYILDSSIFDVSNDIIINAKSTGNISASVDGDSHGGVAVGASVVNALIGGNTKVDIGKDVSLKSKNGNITIETNTNENSTASANALTGSLIGGVGAEAKSQTGKNNTVNIGKNANIYAKLAAVISSIAKNVSTAKTNGRAYGVVSAGGTKTDADITQVSGVNIADADKNANGIISAQSIKIYSTADNNVSAQTKAGAGAISGISGSGVYTDINSSNNVVVGENYTVNTADGEYVVAANNTNKYKSYNDSSAYGVVGVSAGIIENTVNSTVNATSNANITANGQIEIFANNTVKKDAVSNYDLYGGAGGVVGVGAACLTDNIAMVTDSTLGGDYAYSTGKYDSGYINVSSQSILDVNEKVDVTAGGAIPVADGNVTVKSDVNTRTTISNKDIKTLDDDIYYLANSDVNIYTKSNVESYGGVAVADGESIAKNNNALTSVIVNSGVNSVSGRDTYIQSICDKSVQAYMYASTKGLIGTVGDSEATAYNNSRADISIANGANLKSYDSMNLTVLDSTSNVTAERKAKGTTYIVFGIPITIYGKGNEYETNSSNAQITLNGTLESGLGSNKTLVIKQDGSYEANGIHVIGKQKVGEISDDDIQADIDAYEISRKGELNQVDDYISVEQNIISNLNDKLNEYTEKRDELNIANKTYDTAIKNANTIIANNNSIENIESVTSAWDSAYTISEKVDPVTGETTTTYSLDSSFGKSLANYSADSNLSAVLAAYEVYNADKSDANLALLRDSVEKLSDTKTELQLSSDGISDTITNINSNIDCSNNSQLFSFQKDVQNKMDENSETISKYDTSIVTIQNSVNDAQDSINNAKTLKVEINRKYDAIIADLQKQIQGASNGVIPVYSLMIDNIYVHSGDTNITGNMIGSGAITAPGNTFTVDIVNNSISDIVYKDIQIGRDITGNINGSNIASSITKNILNNNNEYRISITNTVDANDPTIQLNTKNGYGDMVFRGNVENVNGLVNFVNNTGNILSEGSITAKDLKISVPNGGYTQDYSNNTIMVSGGANSSAIIASGDIDIASKVIDINGLVQSGSEIKSVTIPQFTVIKKGEDYYQVVNGIETKMEKGVSDGYYYLNLEGNGQLDSDLEMIKAYFKPSEVFDDNSVKGEIHLFKAEIQGGNITLTGNVISTSNNGKIVLVNGYGHIDIVNNSNYDLVTSAISADGEIQGKLTINDFKFSDTDKAGSSFDDVTQNNLDDQDWLSKNSGTYTAQVDSDGNIVTTSTGVTTGNGSWGGQSYATREDGANVSTIMYNPGDDAYIVTKAGSVEVKSYQEYVKRSWWTELFHGKLYRTVYYNVVNDPEYGVAKNPITVQFQGFDTPQINVTSNSSIILNSPINAIAGDINLISNNGSIIINNAKNIISAQNIGLSALNGDIGSSLKPIQTAILNKGTLNAEGRNIYINYPYSDLSNINLTATNHAYIATSGSKLGGLDNIINVKADFLELVAEDGSINLDASKNSNINIEVNKIKARANGDISLTNKNDLNISSIVSKSLGTITLGSQNGSIIAAETESISPYHINGGNVILEAVNGFVGSGDAPLKIARDGIYKVNARDDINIYSSGRIYADVIQSTNGKVVLDADYGIIASESSKDLVYNIYSSTGVDLHSKYGNIENIAINTDGVVNASAGYSDGNASGMSDISISLISKKEIAQEDLAQMTAEERQVALENYSEGLKDMKIGTVQASNNVFITSEKSILNADSNSSIKAERVVLSASNGSVGEDEAAVKLSVNRDVTAYAGNGKDVYLTSDKDLKVNEIRSYNKYNSETGETTSDSTLGNVVLSSAANITNAAIDDDKANVSAVNIVLNAQNDIGSSIKYFTVDTRSNNLSQGLTYEAEDAYIKGLNNDLNIVESNVYNISNITADEGLSIIVQNSTAGDSLNIDSTVDTTLTGDISAQNIIVNSQNKTNLADVTTDGVLVNLSDSIVANNAELNNLTTSSVTANITDTTISEYGNITTTDSSILSNVNVGGDFTNTSKNTNVNGKLTVNGDVKIKSEDTISITNADIKSDAMLDAGKTIEIGEIVVGDNATINAGESIHIANADIAANLNSNAKEVTIEEMNLAGNFNSKVDNLVMNTSNNLNIGSIVGYTKYYTSRVEINSDKSIYNGRDDDGYNITGQTIVLNAGQVISIPEKPLNINLVDGNKISMNASNSISVSTVGATSNWSNITSDKYQLITDEDINIDKLNVNKLNIKTTADNLVIQNMLLGQTAILDVGKKHIVIDNTSLKPIIDADVQLYLSKQPTQIIINGSDNIITDKVNVVRQAQGLTINRDENYGSMNNTLTSSMEAALKNTKVGEKTIEKTDSLIYRIPTLKAYQNKYEKLLGQGVIKNQIDEIITPANAFSIVNKNKYKRGFTTKRETNSNKLGSI